MKSTGSKIIVAGLLASIVAISGCATPSKPDAMVVQVVAPVHKSDGDVSIAVSGGKETSKMGASQISNDAFAIRSTRPACSTRYRRKVRATD